jgi:hypothetical protein
LVDWGKKKKKFSSFYTSMIATIAELFRD